jgi:hypothetical protein
MEALSSKMLLPESVWLWECATTERHYHHSKVVLAMWHGLLTVDENAQPFGVASWENKSLKSNDIGRLWPIICHQILSPGHLHRMGTFLIQAIDRRFCKNSSEMSPPYAESQVFRLTIAWITEWDS